MEKLIKTLRRLNEEEFQSLIEKVTPNKQSKPYKVLEVARTQDVTDGQMIEILNVNASTYYTLKSRLSTKVAAELSRKVDNPISVLLDEVGRAQANLYSTNKQISIRALKELEKQLLEYDLSNELIVVYQALARLHMFNPEFEHYDKLYNKYVAFSLAASKAEGHFYEFILKIGIYKLSRDEADLEAVQEVLRKLANINELYESHRLFFFFSVVRLYFALITTDNVDALRQKEIEFEENLNELKQVLDRYPLDTMYNNYRFLPNFIFFEFFEHAEYYVRAHHIYQRAAELVPDVAEQHIMGFHVTQFLEAKIKMFLDNNNVDELTDLREELEIVYDVDKEEIYHYVYFHTYLALCDFYKGEYLSGLRRLNSIRSNSGIKQYWHAEAELKLFQALMYRLQGEKDLCLQILNGISRHIRQEKDRYEHIAIFVKLLKAGYKTTEYDKKLKRTHVLWDSFREQNQGREKILTYLKLSDRILDKLAQP